MAKDRKRHLTSDGAEHAEEHKGREVDQGSEGGGGGVTDAVADAVDEAPVVAGKIGGADSGDVVEAASESGDPLTTEYRRLEQEETDAIDKVHQAARLVAAGDELSPKDQKDLAVIMRTAKMLPEEFHVIVSHQKSRLELRDAVRDLPAATEALEAASADHADLLNEKARLIAEIDAKIETAGLAIVDAQSRVRVSSKAMEKLRRSAPLHLRNQVADANRLLGAAEESLRVAENNANKEAEELQRDRLRLDATADGTRARSEAMEQVTARGQSMAAAKKAADIARIRLEDAKDMLAEAIEACERA